MSLFTAGITLAADGSGALVVAEKIPRKTDRLREVWSDGTIIDREPIWECAIRFVGVEELAGPLLETVVHISNRLRAEPLLDDTFARIDISEIGRPILALLRQHRAHAAQTLVGGEKEATDTDGSRVLPIAVLQATATLMLETGRVEVSAGLIDGPSLLHDLTRLSTLPKIGPARDLGIAAALALHCGANSGGSEWPSTKPKPQAMLDAEWSREMKREAQRKARGPRW